ncbi:hypothetical protein HB904_04060 [Listeria booriae]|uniref:Uncharacterized protein n=1 Tax=Listeria booriae TaxID=1552123 RepID=A0A842ADF1_9LIST|nr:hypothetical protein [Listeria booriae]MBC1615347.1 hypothetical protein [Listeria booriae]
MKTSEYEEIRKNEGDRYEFKYKGFDCKIIRIEPSTNGHLCGYVAIPWESKLHGISIPEIEGKYDIHTHGGITYAEFERDNQYWLGFDCAHAGDLIPTFKYFYNSGETYRDMEYVKKNLMLMVDSIIEVGVR